MKRIRIGKHEVGPDKPVFVIAEAGVNHNGKLSLALKLVDAATRAGADAVKFQTFQAGQLVTKNGKMAAYQKRNTGKNESQFKMLEKLSLNEKFYDAILRQCKKRGIIFLSAPHGGFESVTFLQKLGVPAFKFSSADLTNLPVLETAARFKKPLILSTGMADTKEIDEAVHTIRKSGNDNIILLQCTTDYPTPPNEVNVRVLETLRGRYKTVVGFSDHTEGSQAAVMAVTLGASVVEKHLTLDKKMKGPDHKASASPAELKEYVTAIRAVETLLGSSEKRPTKSEIQYIPLVRKSVVAKTDIKKGSLFTSANLTIKRPGTGLHPRMYKQLIGKKAQRNIFADSLLSSKDI